MSHWPGKAPTLNRVAEAGLWVCPKTSNTNSSFLQSKIIFPKVFFQKVHITSDDTWIGQIHWDKSKFVCALVFDLGLNHRKEEDLGQVKPGSV